SIEGGLSMSTSGYLDGEFFSQREFGLSQFISPATDISVRRQCQHGKIFFGEKAHHEAHLLVFDHQLAQLTEIQIISRTAGAADKRSQLGGSDIKISRGAFLVEESLN